MGKQSSGPPDSVKKAWKYASSHKENFVDSLKNLVRQPSVSAQNIGLKECAEMVREQMASLGLSAKLIKIPGAPDVVYATSKSEHADANTLVIYNHYDVQPAEPLEEWKSDPYNPVVRNGKLFGRGVGDDKGELVARLNALRAVLDSGEKVKSNLKWFVEGEEEVGSPHLHGFVEKNKSLLSGDGCLWEAGDRSPGGRSEIHLGVKGLLYVQYRVKVGKKDQHSQYGAIAPNPAWRLVNLLKTIRNDEGKILIKGFYENVQPPTRAEKELIRANEFSIRQLQTALEVDYLLEEQDDVATITKHLYSPTANIAGFSSGYQGKGAKTIVPKEAFAKMDFRLVANMKARDILAKLRNHMREKGFSDVELEVFSGEDPAKTPVESYIAQTMIQCVELAEGERPNVWPTIAGTGPMSLFTNLVGVPTAMGLGINYPGASFHAPNENIVLDYYHGGVKQLICLYAMF